MNASETVGGLRVKPLIVVSVNIRQEGQRTSEGIVKEFKSGFGAKPIIALRETELCNKPLRASGYVGFFTRRAFRLPTSCRANSRDPFGCTRVMNILALRCSIEAVGDRFQLRDASGSRSVRPVGRSAVCECRSSVSRIWGFISYDRR